MELILRLVYYAAKYTSPGSIKPFLASRTSGDTELFRLLCEAKPAPNFSLKSFSGSTVLELAVSSRNEGVVKYLLNNHSNRFPENEIGDARSYVESLQDNKFEPILFRRA